MKEFYIHRFRSETGQPDSRRTLIRVDDNGLITHADCQAEAILGFGADDLLSRPITHIAAAGQDDPFSPRHRHGFEAGRPVLLTLRHKDGFFFTAQVSLRVDIRDSDQPANAFISLRDSTHMDPRLLALIENSGQLGVWELDMLTNQITWTEGLYRLLELRPGADITPEQALFYCQNAQSRLRALFRRCACTGQPFSIDLDVITARQHIRRVRVQGRAFKNGQRIARVGGTLVNLSDLQQKDDAHTQARQMLQAVMTATDDLVAAVDRDLTLLCFNHSFSRQMELTFGLTPVEGDNLGDLLEDFPNERRLIQRLWSRAFERQSFVVEMPLAQQNRELPVYEVRYQQLLDPKGDVLGAVQVARDITQRVRSDSSRHYLSRHDPVTGLLNRREFASRLERLLENRRATPVSHSLLYLDLDNLADFNERAGTGACDRYLRELAGALGPRVRQRDALARVAGDTFALLIENCHEHEARKVSQALVERIAGFTFEWQNQPLNTTASAGLLLLDEASSGSPDHLLAQAAELCLTAKTAGRNRVHTASARPENSLPGDGRDLLGQLQRCLDNDGLVLEYQSLSPVASVTWGDHIEVLARLRMDGANDQLMQPEEFLPIAERFDLTRDIDRRVISKTLTWLAGHSLLEPRLKYCGFNLSLASVLDESFADFMRSALTGLPFLPGCFCLEIRESDATQYPDEVAVFCDSMHQIGCRIALDGRARQYRVMLW